MRAPSQRILGGVARALAPADAARRLVLRGAARLVGARALARWSRGRELRVATYGVVGVASALAFTALAPLWLLALGPVVLGVPHLASDLRYLVARPGLHRELRFWLGVALPVALAGATGRSAWAGVAAAGAAAVASGPLPRRALVTLGGAALAVVAGRAGPLADLAFAHLHNLMAVALFWAYRARATRTHLLPLGLFAAGSLALGLGAFDSIALWSLSRSPLASLPLELHLDTLAPAWAVGSCFPRALRLVLLFAFAQSVHYGIWLRLVPEEARPRPAPRSFAMSLRALVRDLGLPLLGVCCALGAFFLAFAALDLAASRDLYLRVAGFHGSLEVGVLAWALATGRRIDGLLLEARAT